MRERAREGWTAVLKFGLVLAIYASVPNREMDVLYGLNPRHIWVVVVFVSGVSFLGYGLSRLVGPERGVGLTGFFGGCIASTPTVVSMAEKARRNPEMDSLYTFGAFLVCVAMIAKVFAIVAIVSLPLARSLFVPFLGMTLLSLTFALIVWMRFQSVTPPEIELDDRFRIKPALVFGAFVALVLLGVAAVDTTVPTAYVEIGAVATVLVNLVMKTGISRVGGTRTMTRSLLELLVLNSVIGFGLVLAVPESVK
jgi:uncharacterized membrane protein (DUF4010 family)